MATETTTEEDVYEALEEVIDPELGLDFVSLGLVYDVEIEGPEAFITFTLTTPACPIGPQVSEQMREFVGQLQGVEKVHPKMVFDPPWSPEMMSEDAKFALGLLSRHRSVPPLVQMAAVAEKARLRSQRLTDEKVISTSSSWHQAATGYKLDRRQIKRPRNASARRS